MKTYKFRLKNKNLNHLPKMASAVNFVWNYCNQTAIEYLDKHNKWLSSFDLTYLTVGCSKMLPINASTIYAVSDEFVAKRSQYKKRKLSWRSSKRSLGWIPVKGLGIKVKSDRVIYNKITFRFWKSREIKGKIKCARFSQDSKGNWYVSIVCESAEVPKIKSGGSIGIDLGLKTVATLSNGTELTRDNLTKKYEHKLATAQRAIKKKQVKAIHAKIKNSRKDWTHKATTKLINTNDQIFVGNVSSSKLKKTRLAKSVSDAGWYDFKSMLAYKAITLGVEYKEVKESFSTVTCSSCFERTGPSGLSGLGVREWACSCGASHNRDVNAAKNILRFGRESLIKRNPAKEGVKWKQVTKILNHEN